MYCKLEVFKVGAPTYASKFPGIDGGEFALPF
jgi:hypothetical protein